MYGCLNDCRATGLSNRVTLRPAQDRSFACLLLHRLWQPIRGTSLCCRLSGVLVQGTAGPRITGQPKVLFQSVLLSRTEEKICKVEPWPEYAVPPVPG